MSNKVLVVSSANMDFVMNMNAVPAAGQTVIDSGSYRYVPGGKGANSAVAFRRLGGDCVFCCKLGRDANGDALRKVYENEGMDTRFIATDADQPTGLAAIFVEANGVVVEESSEEDEEAIKEIIEEVIEEAIEEIIEEAEESTEEST